MRASRKAYGSNSFFQSYIKILYHQQDFCVLMSLLGSKDTLNGLTEASGVRWYGHDLRKDNGDVIRKALDFELVERRKRERQNMT